MAGSFTRMLGNRAVALVSLEGLFPITRKSSVVSFRTALQLSAYLPFHVPKIEPPISADCACPEMAVISVAIEIAEPIRFIAPPN